jgi:hypothetical protein
VRPLIHIPSDDNPLPDPASTQDSKSGSSRNPTPASGAHLRHLKSVALRALGLPRSTVVSVAELRCPDPGCPDVETVFTVHGTDGAVRRFRFASPLQRLTAAAVRDLISGPACGEQDRPH